MKRKYKLLLINPRNTTRSGQYMTNDFSVPPLGLGMIAALTPENWDIEILDENFDEFEYKDADFVGFTALTSQVYRAYQISEIYKNNNIPTVIGGIHATMMPEESSKYCDAVVIGEAESIWKQVINDFENNNLKKFYNGTLEPLDKIPLPRIDLYNNKYSFGSIQTTRGCPHKCDFCTVPLVNGHKHRFRQVEDVIKEFIKIPQNSIYVVDDDFYGYGNKSITRAKEICKAIINSGVKKQWYTFTSLSIASDSEMLDLMYRSGCRMILLGIESENTDQLISSNKKTNLKRGVEKYFEVFEAIHKAGMGVLGSFIFGLDTDTHESIIQRAKYYVQSGIDCIQAGVLTPLSGTGAYFRLKEQNRIIHNNYPADWEKYNFFQNVITSGKMSSDELVDAMDEAWSIIYNVKTIKKKFLNTLKVTKDLSSAGWCLSTNVKYRNTIFEGINEDLSYSDIFYELTSHRLSF